MKTALASLSAAHLRVLFEYAPDMLGRFSPEGRVLWVSNQSLDLLGYAPEDLAGRRVREFIHPEDIGGVSALRDKLIQQQSVAGLTCRGMHRDGSVRWLHTNGRAIRDPGTKQVRELLCSSRDVTHLHEPERPLANAERQAAELLRHLPAAAFVISLDHCYKYVNPYWERVTGLKDEQVRGLHFSAIWPESEARAFVELGQRTASTGKVVELDQELPLPAGRRRFHSVRFPLRNQAGVIVATAGVSLDITATFELEARRKEQEKLEAIARLAGGIAHEFNNSLTVLLAYAQMIQLPETPSETARQYAASIEVSVQQSAGLIRNLLTFAGRARFTPQPLDLALQVRQREPLLRSLIGPRIGLTLELRTARLACDPAQIDVILKALASYAVKAMPAGGSLSLRVWSDASGVVLEARDNSGGLPPLARSQLFEPFHELRVGGDPVSLDLSTAYGVVLQMGGGIEVETPETGGVVITIRFPGEPQG